MTDKQYKKVSAKFDVAAPSEIIKQEAEQSDESIFQQYYDVRHQIDELATLETKLKELVISELEKSETNTVKNEFGNFTKRVSKRYAFSFEVKDKELEITKLIQEFAKPLEKQIEDFSTPLKKLVEDKKQEEIEKGVAKEQVTVSMAFSYSDHKN